MKKISILFFMCILIAYSANVFGTSTEQPELLCQSAVLIDANTGIVLYEKNADEVQYPASTTKVMTALLLLEKIKTDAGFIPAVTDDPLSSPSFDVKIYFSQEAVGSIEVGSSNIAMNPDETLTARDALYAIMLPSANEVSAAIAEYVSGSLEDFAALMTERAKELGCTDTNFKNAHGLPDDEHYTTAHDLARIFEEAVKHPEFIEAISTVSYQIAPTEKQPENRNIANSNKLIKQGEFYLDYIVGGKTGYTDAARHTLVVLGEKDGKKLICALLHGEKNEPYKDAETLMEYGFSFPYVQKEPFSADFKTNIIIEGISVSAVPSEKVSFLVPEQTTMEVFANWDANATLPVDAGDSVGVLTISSNGQYLGTVGLLAAESVAAPVVEDLSEQEAEFVFAENTENVTAEKNKKSPVVVITLIVTGLLVAGIIAAYFFRSKLKELLFPKKREYPLRR
ncbi:MAG: D-alanyl-D-alanine carboxypeptidase [Clostridiales bacterium]|jgi:D-alanyl-D-alanine carboxypeptidase|nr:D-alanyl-D-alanine carboxypeptidase [Clostridiales bacterium]